MSKIEQPNTELNIYSTEVLRECKFVVHIPKYLDRPDMHYVKEKLTMPDGTIVKNLRKIKEFKRPFYVLKEHFRNYKQKKESEHIDRLNRYTATESDLIEEAGKKLGPMYIGKNNLRYVKDSPYLYGCDITAATLIKKAYMDKFNLFTNYDVCVLDIEKEIDGDQRLTVMSISDAKRTFTAILKDWLPETKDNRDKLQNAYKRYIPNVEYMQDIEDVTEFYDTEVDMIVAIFKKLHEWQPDIVEVWNITYDIDNILKVLDKAGINPADIFNDPSIPKRDRYFRFKKGKTSKVTEKGVHKGLAFQEQWHTVINIASFYFVDGASVYHYIRQGGKKVPGGYSLDNILKVHLGDNFKKITIEDGIAEKLDKMAWHIYMSKNRKIEYVIYNKYDTRGPLLLDREIKDICFTMPLLNVNSPFYMFDSNPVRIVENMYFFYLEKNEIMGTAPNTKDEDKKLGLGNWIFERDVNKIVVKKEKEYVIYKPLVINGIEYYLLDWVLGIRYYEIGFIKLYLDGLLNYPKEVLEKVHIHYEDGEMYYSFLPIEYKAQKGYYYIPYFSGFYINRNGDVLDTNHKKLNTCTTKPPKNNVKNIRGGYKTISINNKRKQLHRLLCLTFKKYSTNPKKLFVNHIDGEGGNNNLSNLEWVTPRENLIHAINNKLMPNSIVPITSMCLNTGNVKSFNSITDASRHHNINKSTIYNRLIRESAYKKHTWNLDGIIFKYEKNNWWEIPKKQYLDRCPKNINVYDILYNTNVLYKSYISASKGTGVNTTSISQAIRDNKTTLIKKRFIFTLS